jgi:hypothetical protein
MLMHKMEVVKSFKYLGLECFKNGNWARSQKRLADHAAFAFHKLYVVEMKVRDVVQLFNSFVRSILLYASEVWVFNEAKYVELIQNKLYRKLLGVIVYQSNAG